MFLFVLQLAHERLGQVGPYFGKGTVLDIAETVMAPELIRMDTAVPADTPDSPAGAVAFVHLEKFQDFRAPLRIFFAQSQIEVGAVGVVVHGEYFLGFAPVMEIFGPIDNQVHHPPGFFMGQVMRATQGKADPNATRRRLQEMLDAS